MHDASTPITFQRHCHQLRAVMIDNRPWFVAIDFALMIAAARPYRLTKRLYPHQHRFAMLRFATGRCEELELISDEVIPALYDYHREVDASPRRILMTWANQRVGALRWQGELWIARRDLPHFMAAHDDPALSDGPSWKRFF